MGILLVFLFLSSCTVIGGFTDAIMLNNKAHLFQNLGNEIDKKIIKKVSKRKHHYAAKRKIKRNCRYQTISMKECKESLQKLKEQEN